MIKYKLYMALKCRAAVYGQDWVCVWCTGYDWVYEWCVYSVKDSVKGVEGCWRIGASYEKSYLLLTTAAASPLQKIKRKCALRLVLSFPILFWSLGFMVTNLFQYHYGSSPIFTTFSFVLELFLLINMFDTKHNIKIKWKIESSSLC